MHNDSNEIVGGVSTGDLPESKAVKKGNGQRGGDIQKRKPRRCARCKKWYEHHVKQCKGIERGASSCDFWDEVGIRRCGRCARINIKNQNHGIHAYNCAAAKCSLEDWDDDECQFYSKKDEKNVQNL